ncbi:cysteine--tRNA ligase [Thalassolituus oleivorans]|uniref:cysteine--tRNA ligase n=1 Tax=Thalassolituus oleivorans TaxID=187493 RepID=UPI00042DD105|nr:cysteine--tRNA ligase [Thalassolituus oleivorans]AHK15773.1 cysteinyl-tRNA synthetase [Thalassolituus oleivorans R6-15]
MSLQIYNTLTRQKETFKPLVEGKVGMYVCGMTVYDFCHLGHARAFLAFDLIVRYMRHIGLDVNYIRNVTDIDDKIIKRANENGEPFLDLVDRFANAMNEDFDQLGIGRPTHEPRATAHIDDIIKLVSTLIDKGFAYAVPNGDVYYRVRKFDGYGKLSGKVLDDLEAGSRVDVDTDKEDPLDFVLWKAAKPEEPHWESPWGIGRPGWHIECSAMSTCCLGETFDIHGGGPDLKFPHHENEIAQSEAATGKTYANTWIHAGALRLGEEKMSKSLGNFFTIRDILEKYNGEVVRFFLISSHYRSHVSYMDNSLDEAHSKLERFYNALQEANVGDAADIDNEYSQRFHAAMDDDFNTPEAIAALFDLVREVNKTTGEEQQALAGQLKYLGGVLGCLQADPQTFLQAGAGDDAAWIEEMIAKRIAAKKAKDFATADAVRDELVAKGIVLKDGPEGTVWTKS